MKMGMWDSVIIMIIFSSLTDAHRPLAPGTTCAPQFSSPDDALVVPDIGISWSVKRIHSCGPPEARGMWLTWENKDPEASVYVGSGVPTVERFQWIRVDYMIVGPGLDATPIETGMMQEANVPLGIQRQIQALNASHPHAKEHGFGGILVQAPADQSTCDHLKSSLVRSCTVRYGRCDFWEPFGGSHSWRVVDEDHHRMPVKGAMYSVVAWLQQDTTGKFGVAIGTWQEDFSTNYGDQPVLQGCEADNRDFSEKRTLPEDDKLPYLSCDANIGVEDLEKPGAAWSGPAECAACGKRSCRGPCAKKMKDWAAEKPAEEEMSAAEKYRKWREEEKKKEKETEKEKDREKEKGEDDAKDDMAEANRGASIRGGWPVVLLLGATLASRLP